MRKLNRLLMAALVLVPLAACDEGDDTIAPTPEPPAVGTVSGTISVEGTGLAGVTVQLAGSTSQSTTTGSNGSYSFANVVEGNYSVTLSGIPGDVVFSNTTQSVSIATNGQTATADFNGQYVRTASILVTVTRADGSGVVTNVKLVGQGVDQTLGTNAQGNVTFSGLRSGSYTVSLVNPPEGFEAATAQNVSVNTGQAVQINFVGATEILPPEDAIERITSAATTLPVDPDSIAGRVEVTINVKPNGNDLETVELWVLQKSTGAIFKIAEQRFASVAPEAQDGDNDDVEVTFSWNSDAFRRKDGSHPSIKMLNTSSGEFDSFGPDAMRPFHPLFVNGDYEVHGRVTVEQFDEGFNAIVDVTLENSDALNLGVVSDNTDWNNPTTGQPFPNFIIQGSTGLRWLSGDVIITAYPIIYSVTFDPNNPLLQRANFSFDGFVGGADVGIGGAELTTPNANGTFTFTFCEAGGATSTGGAACYSSINDVNTGLIGARNIIVATKTAFGQFGPGFNAGAGVNNIKNIEFFNDDLQSGTGVLNDVLRIDNESPVPGSMNPVLAHPANAIPGVQGFSRTGIGGPTNLGWVNWTDNLGGRVVASPSDTPFTYPAVDKNGNAVATWVGYDLNAAFAAGAARPGIGNPAGNPNLKYVRGPDNTAGSVSTVISGATLSTSDALVGGDLPPETDSPGLTEAGSAPGTPFSDTEIDFAMAARHWDLFGNWTNTSNFILFGVDGRAPIYSNSTGTSNTNLALANPVTASTTKYNTFDDDFYDLEDVDPATFGNAFWSVAGKAAGTYTGYTTDRGNGFSGVAGVVVEDFEQGCAAAELACFSTTTTRYGYKLQTVDAGGAAIVFPFTFDGSVDIAGPGLDDFCDDGTDPIHTGNTEGNAGPSCIATAGDDFYAYVAAQDLPRGGDGYRDHAMWTWDRAGNYRIDSAPTEHNDDHDAPDVGNVQMPTAVTYNFTTPLTFNGENADNADLKKTDFTFDFNSILSLQVYSSPSAASHPNQTGPIPPADLNGNLFEETSLQLPLKNVAHTAFGSADIYLGGNLTITTNFLGCLVRADEAGLATVASANDAALGDVGPGEPYMHQPRGPRWRSWDHSSAYGLVNTQFNTFVPTSVPACQTPAAVAAGFIPALGNVGADPDGVDDVLGTQDDEYGWLFNLDASNRPRITFKGSTATFVPNVGPDDFVVYYLDTAGRAILVDNPVWSLIVSDLGTGAFGRWYEYTLVDGDFLDANGNGIPDDLYAGPVANGSVGGWFIVVKGNAANTLAGHGVIWDTTSN